MPAQSKIVAALLACAAVALAVPGRATDASGMSGALPRGGAYVLDPNPTVGVGGVSLWFRAPGAGYANDAPGIARLAATAAAVAPLAGGKSLAALVRSVGGALSVNVYPDIVGIGAVVPAPAVRRVVAAMTAAYFAPAINDAAVKTARSDAAVLSVEERYSSDATLHDLLFAQIFAGGPAHYPPLPETVSALTSISPGAVSSFAQRAFRSSNAVLTLTGNVDPSSLSAITDGSAGPMDPPFDSPLSGTHGQTTAAAPVGGVGLAWVGPPIADEKSATALDFVADYLFRDRTGVVTRALDGSNLDAYASGQFITLHDPGVMLVTLGGGDAKKAATQVLQGVAALRTPLDPATFAAAREAFLYHIASDIETVQGQGDNLGWYAIEGAPDYAPGNRAGRYERLARELDPAYVAGVVNRYLGSQPVSVNLITVSPKGSTS